MSVRYGAILGGVLRTLRRGPAFTERRPTETMRYRARAPRGVAPLADLYLPSRAAGPSVVLIHGGAFVIGSRRMRAIRYLAAHLAHADIGVCAIDYRLIIRGGRLDEAVDDVQIAFDAWRDRAPAVGLDPDRISLVGLSAGASLALLASAQLPRVHRLACCFGLYDVDHMQRGAAQLLPRLLFRTPDRAAWEASAPGTAHPRIPTLLLHGADDDLVPVAQAHRLAERRVALGLPTRLVVYPGAPHGFFNIASDAAIAGARELAAHVQT